MVQGSADVGAIRAALTVVKVGNVTSGRVDGKLRANVIEGDAEVKVVETGDIGSGH